MSNEELTRALKIINDAAISGQDFVLEQAPLIVQEVVTWHIWSSAATSVLCFIILLSTWFAFWLLLKKYLKGRTEPDIAAVVMVLIMLTATSGVICIYNSFQLLKGLTAPRLVVIDYAKEALK